MTYHVSLGRPYVFGTQLEAKHTRHANEANVLTAILVAEFAGRAFPVEDCWPHHGLLSQGEVRYTFSDLLDNTTKLVTHDDRRCGLGDIVRFLGN